MASKTGWAAQQLRISLFPSGGWNTSVDLWPQITGSEKEKQTINSKTGEIINEGWFNKQKLILSVNPVKIDLALTVTTLAHIEEGKAIIDTLNTFEEALKVFKPLVEMWLLHKQIPEITRIAFGAQVVKTKSSHDESYKELKAYTGINLDSSTMTDFKFEINLIKKSKIVKGLELNRLTKWGALQLTPEVTMAGQEGFHTYPTVDFIGLELDINTSRHNKDVFNKKLPPALYSELVSLGYELSETGISKYVK